MCCNRPASLRRGSIPFGPSLEEPADTLKARRIHGQTGASIGVRGRFAEVDVEHPVARRSAQAGGLRFGRFIGVSTVNWKVNLYERSGYEGSDFLRIGST
jgi:hypothetical protein